MGAVAWWKLAAPRPHHSIARNSWFAPLFLLSPNREIAITARVPVYYWPLALDSHYLLIPLAPAPREHNSLCLSFSRVPRTAASHAKIDFWILLGALRPCSWGKAVVTVAHQNNVHILYIYPFWQMVPFCLLISLVLQFQWIYIAPAKCSFFFYFYTFDSGRYYHLLRHWDFTME